MSEFSAPPAERKSNASSNRFIESLISPQPTRQKTHLFDWGADTMIRLSELGQNEFPTRSNKFTKMKT
jgi:hypothetical protein